MVCFLPFNAALGLLGQGFCELVCPSVKDIAVETELLGFPGLRVAPHTGGHHQPPILPLDDDSLFDREKQAEGAEAEKQRLKSL